MLVTFGLGAEGTEAGHAPGVLPRRLQVPFKLRLAQETHQTSQAHEPVIHMVVVLEVVLQAPLVFEGTETQVAEDIVALGVVDMVLETIAIFENANAKVAVVLVDWSLLHVGLKCNLVRELDTAGTTPVFM